MAAAAVEKGCAACCFWVRDAPTTESDAAERRGGKRRRWNTRENTLASVERVAEIAEKDVWLLYSELGECSLRENELTNLGASCKISNHETAAPIGVDVWRQIPRI